MSMKKKDKFKKIKKPLPYSTKKKIYGFMFILPWLIGFWLFFLVPFGESVRYSFEKLESTPKGFTSTYIGLQNFNYALFKDTDFIIQCVNSLKDLIKIPLVIVYSLCFALLLKGKFAGRGLIRAIAFLPVIIGSGVLMQILREDVFSQGIKGSNSVYLFSSGGLNSLFLSMGLNQSVLNFINQIVNAIFDLTWKSGVQILLFLSGLHNIPDYVYEASSMEGARSFEQFFKITLPMLTPMILLNIIYSVIDMFSDYGNHIIQMIYSTAFDQVRLGYSSALALLYFVMVSVVLVLVYLFLKRYIIKQDN
ncbi:MAG TPA: sugar ABC transporter permease [Mobilitalea sp.]|nr:sugar ABC transporter permease [Mobilitalea sp.]